MTKRGWWLVGMNFLIPGSAQVLAGSRKLGRFGLAATLVLWTLAVASIVVFFAARGVLFSIFTLEIPLLIVQAVLAAYAVLWLVLTIDTLRLANLVRALPAARALVAALAVVLLVSTAGTAAYAAYIVGVQRGFVGTLFGAGPTAEPIDGRYNILLLGGDAGPDRQGLRPDSITVVSIEASTGKTVMIGLPRNLDSVPFSEGSPMLELYPDGYRRCNVDVCMLNSIYTEVQLYSPELYPDAAEQGSSPGIEAMRDAAEGATGLQIQYYALIDMQGFSDLIDALGGVTIDVKQRVAMGAGHDEYNDPVPITAWIEPGVQTLDGFHALWYARSRYLTSDYDRMERQRELQQAIITQFEPINVLTKFRGIAEAGSQVVKTDIPQSMLAYFAQLALKAREQPVSTVDVPALVDPEYDPDYSIIQGAVAEAVAPSDADAG